MLKEPLIVHNPVNGIGSETSSYINAPQDGKSSRTCPYLAESIITINQGVSNENGRNVTTNRTNVRVTQAQALGDTGTFVKGYAQLTMSFPKGTFTAAEVQALVAVLFNFVSAADTIEGVDNPRTEGTVIASELLLIPRLYAGES